MKQTLFLITVYLLLTNFVLAGERAVIDLSGEWKVRLDREQVGETEEWWSATFSDTLHLPGSLTAQGYGDEVNVHTPWTATTRDEIYEAAKYAPYKVADNFKYPFWLQPDKYYRGKAWYQQEVQVPDSWGRKRIVLSLERSHWETSVWVNDRKVGSSDSLSTAHAYDLTEFLSPGKNRLTIMVDNSINLNVGINSHSISDHTQGNWNGIAGAIKLYATNKLWIDDVQVYPDVDNKQAKVRVTLGNLKDSNLLASLEFQAKSINGHATDVIEETLQISGSKYAIETVIPFGGDIQLWDEFSPILYDLSVRLSDAAGVIDEIVTRFGIRKVDTKGTQFTINDRPVFLRGTLECAIFPITGHPAMDVGYWRKIIQTCKNYGLNHMRFHSWCPPEAAFVAADELGFYFQVECASWANQGVTIGDGNPLDDWLYAEGERITKAYGNHPSFVLMAYGNEPGGKNRDAYLAEWCNYWKENEPRILHTTGAGWPLLEESDYHNTHRNVRIQAWGAGLKSVINAKPPQTRFDFAAFMIEHSDKPTISHEIGQWCVYPNFNEIEKYIGPLKPRNFEIFRDFLESANMADQAHDFLMASGKLQALCYKHDIEASLRTKGFGGFQLLDLHDFPGQGTALVGILDPFWEDKGYITSGEHRNYCSPTVPLARIDKMVWTYVETFEADVEIAHFGPESIQSGNVKWSLKSSGGRMIGNGAFKPIDLPTGQNTEVGRIQVPLGEVSKAGKLVLTIEVPEAGAVNTWDIWCYPTDIDTSKPAAVHVTTVFDKTATAILKDGGSVILMIPPDQVKTDVALGFSSIFWNTAWTQGQAPHTLGILCDPAHPALQEFPTDFHSNWQWWDLITKAATMEMDAFPKDLRPIVQVVPDWFEPKRLGLVYEANVGNGKLLVSSIDLMTNLEERPVAQQMLSSLYRYVSSPEFQPNIRIKISDVRSLLQ